MINEFYETFSCMLLVRSRDRMSENSRSAYDVIVNATLAFGEDLQLIRSSLSNSTADVQFLLGQDKKTVRGFEDLRSANRRHEANIQSVTTQLGEFRNQVSRTGSTIRPFYSRIYFRINEKKNELLLVHNKKVFPLPKISVLNHLHALLQFTLRVS